MHHFEIPRVPNLKNVSTNHFFGTTSVRWIQVVCFKFQKVDLLLQVSDVLVLDVSHVCSGRSQMFPVVKNKRLVRDPQRRNLLAISRR